MLHSWQQKHANAQLTALRRSGLAIDASDTGIGKTYIAAWVAKQYGHAVFVVAPKAVHKKWREVLGEFGVEPIDVINIEKLKRRPKYLAPLPWGGYSWRIFPGTLIIVDEIHNFGGPDTENAKILAALQPGGNRVYPVYGLSATLANSPLRLRALGVLANLFRWHEFYRWALNHGAVEDEVWTPRGRKRIVAFYPGTPVAKAGVKKIHTALFESGRANRIRAGETPDFPENFVSVDCIHYDATTEIKKAYKEMEHRLQANPKLEITKLLDLRQHIEQLRLSDIAETVKELAEDKQVVVFLNFRDSIDQLQKLLGGGAVEIHGGTSMADREAAREAFQAGRNRVCLCTYGAGGVGLDLHDLIGVPRVSLLNPTWSATLMVQALGRIWRAGSRSPAVQRITYAADTVEERVAARVRAGLTDLQNLQDGDLRREFNDYAGNVGSQPGWSGVE